MKIIKESDNNSVNLACESLNNGQVIAIATDTVYGLAVDASNPQAIEKLYQIKKRDPKKPIAIFVKDLASAKEIFNFDEKAEEIATKFLPGALTIILKTKIQADKLISKDLNKDNPTYLGFRIIDSDFINKLLERSGKILAVTSANPAQEESATTVQEVKNYFKNSQLELIIEGKKSKNKSASTVIKIDNNKISIIRNGSLNINS